MFDIFLKASIPLALTTDAERTLDTFGVKGDLTRLYGRHAVKGGIDLALLRPREDFSTSVNRGLISPICPT